MPLKIILLISNFELTEAVKVIPNVYLIFGAFLLLIFFTVRLFYFFEMTYVEYVNKTLFVNHVYFWKKKLTKEQKSILRTNFQFYQKLSIKYQTYFEHRVYQFINTKEFIGNNVVVSEEMRVVISATLVKLTFGLRDYNIKSVERIIFYPEEFYSQTNKAYHKGEFNLGLKALVFSWKDVLYGYEVADDNLNLAIHEFTHAIHFYYMSVRRRSTSAAIFIDTFEELTTMLDNEPALKTKLVESNFLRDYAYTNQFSRSFPSIYRKVKTMLGFDFIGY